MKQLLLRLIVTFFLIFFGIAPIALLARQRSSESPSTSLGRSKSAIARAYGNLPVSFEANHGQTDASVKFFSRGHDYALLLKPSEAVLYLHHKADKQLDLSAKSAVQQSSSTVKAFTHTATNKDDSITFSALHVQLMDANPKARIDGVNPLPGKTNYFTGSDPQKWQLNVPTYSRVAYRNVYKGIDQIYYSNEQRQLEYDFVVAPGADPRVIRLRFVGTKSLKLASNGDLVMVLPNGQLIQHAPAIYQERGGRRDRIDGECVLIDANTIGFRVAAYDKSRTLTIDPGLVYSTYLGGSEQEEVGGIAVDALGNAYVAGSTLSTNFPTTPGSFQPAFVGSTTPFVTSDAFVTKLNPSGTELLYSTYIGGSFSDSGLAIAVDSSGDAYIVGITVSPDFPTTVGAIQTSFGGPAGTGGFDAFITKLNPDGSRLLYSTYLGGNDIDIGSAIAVDASGSAYVTGCTRSLNFPTTSGAFQTSFGGTGSFGINCDGFSHAFVAKLQPNGTALAYSTFLGGGGADEGNGIAVDASGNAYVVGSTQSSDFPITAGAVQPLFGGGFADAFLTKLNSTGTALIYSTFLGATGEDEGFAIAIDSSRSAYVTGFTFSLDFPTTTGAFQTACPNSGLVSLPCDSSFVTKINTAGSAFVYSTFLGSARGLGIALDALGEATVTGETISRNFPTTSDALRSTFPSGNVGFVSRLNPTGASLRYSTFLAGNSPGQNTTSRSVAVDRVGTIYVAGVTSQSDFPTSGGAFQTKYGGGFTDAFVVKIAQAIQIQVVIEIKPPTKAPVPINPRSKGITPVAILSAATFNATTIMPASVRLNGSSPKRCVAEDVNGDGLPDFLCDVPTPTIAVPQGISEATLTAQTSSGITIQGQEQIKSVPPGY